jgi:hypothetical protein
MPRSMSTGCGANGTSVLDGCDAFLTNDHTLRRVTEIPVLVLDDLLEGADQGMEAPQT